MHKWRMRAGTRRRLSSSAGPQRTPAAAMLRGVAGRWSGRVTAGRLDTSQDGPVLPPPPFACLEVPCRNAPYASSVPCASERLGRASTLAVSSSPQRGSTQPGMSCAPARTAASRTQGQKTRCTGDDGDMTERRWGKRGQELTFRRWQKQP